jgi:uncharacterized metal-binding protein YceD (DUF177 family)
VNIFYKDIEDDIISLETSFSFADNDETIDVKAFQGELIKISDGTAENFYFLRGNMSVALTCPCDRCGGDMVANIEIPVAVNVIGGGELPTPPTDNEYEMTDEDGDIYTTPLEFIDLDDILRQEVLLQMPLKRICKQECETIESNETDDKPLKGLAQLSKLKH